MPKRVSIFWIVVLSILIASIIPLGLMAYDALSSATITFGQVIVATLVFVVVAFGVAFLLFQAIIQPLIRLSRTAGNIQQAVEKETAGPLFSESSLEVVNGTREVSDLVRAFSAMLTALQQRINELNSIYAMAQTITANVDFDATLQAVLSAVGHVVDSDAAEVSLLDDTRLVVQAWRGKENFNNTSGRTYRLGEGLTGMLAESRVITYLPSIDSVDLQSTLGYQAMTMQKELLTRTTKLVIRSFLGLPLMSGDRLVGTLTLVHHEPNYFTEVDKRQLNKVAAQASIAIENAVKVREREMQLQEQIKALQIEIDESNKARQVQEIVETDFFRDLQSRADTMRARRNMGNQATQEMNTQDTMEMPSVPDSTKPTAE